MLSHLGCSLPSLVFCCACFLAAAAVSSEPKGSLLLSSVPLGQRESSEVRSPRKSLKPTVPVSSLAADEDLHKRNESESEDLAAAAPDITATFRDQMLVEIEFELNREVPHKNKVILIIIELLGLGVFGVDRCYVGQCCLGTVKGLTLGGLAVWSILDYIGVAITCLSMSQDLNSLGMHAVFESSTSNLVAFILFVTVWPVLCWKGLSMMNNVGAKMEAQPNEQDGVA